MRDNSRMGESAQAGVQLSALDGPRWKCRWHVQKDYVTDQGSLRSGECNQCGNCCRILYKCPFLAEQDDDTSYCTIYENRPEQCGAYPIDERCLAEVDFDCTYSFATLPQEELEGMVLLQIDPVGSSD